MRRVRRRHQTVLGGVCAVLMLTSACGSQAESGSSSEPSPGAIWPGASPQTGGGRTRSQSASEGASPVRPVQGPEAEEVRTQVAISIAALREGAFDAAYLFESDAFQKAVPLEEYIQVHTACLGGLDRWIVHDVTMVSDHLADVTHVYAPDLAETDRFVKEDGRWRWPTRPDVVNAYARGSDDAIQRRRADGICTPADGDGHAWDCPHDRPVKGNTSFTTNERIYHQPESRVYPVTSPDECFASSRDAEAAGYRRAFG